MDPRFHVEVAMDGEVLWTFADLAADDRSHAVQTAIALVADALHYRRDELAARARPVDATAPDEVRSFATHATATIDRLMGDLAERGVPRAAVHEFAVALDVARRSIDAVSENADAYRVSTARRVARPKAVAA